MVLSAFLLKDITRHMVPDGLTVATVKISFVEAFEDGEDVEHTIQVVVRLKTLASLPLEEVERDLVDKAMKVLGRAFGETWYRSGSSLLEKGRDLDGQAHERAMGRASVWLAHTAPAT